MKAIQEHFAAINAAESELSMAVFEAIFDIKVNDAKSACAKEIADEFFCEEFSESFSGSV